MHVSKYAIDLTDARRVVSEHGWARVITVGEEGLRATYGFFLLEDSEADEIVVAGHFARADPQCADIEARAVLPCPAGWPHPHPELAALMRRLSLANP